MYEKEQLHSPYWTIYGPHRAAAWPPPSSARSPSHQLSAQGTPRLSPLGVEVSGEVPLPLAGAVWEEPDHH